MLERHGYRPRVDRPASAVIGLVLLTLVLGLALEPEASAAASGLVAAYGFDEGSGTVAADGSGAGNAGTAANTTWSASGRFGSALSFNGTSSLVSVPDAAALRLTTGMTLEAWVNPSSATGWRTVAMKERSGGLSYGVYGFDNSSKPPAVYGNFSGTDTAAAGTSALPVNQWSHVAGTYDGTTLRMYVNGVLAGSKAKSGSLASSTGSPLRIGGNAAWGEYFAGLIDEVRVYNRALSASEIQGDMTTPVTATGPDTTPPVITARATSNVSPSSVNVTWTTNEPATSQVSYGATAAYGSSATLPGLLTAHTVPVTGLSPGTTYHYRVTSADAAGNPASSADATFTTAALDTTAPTVGLTAPAGGATVGGSAVTVSASATDDVAVAAVQFLLDGATIGTEDTSAPYSISWDTGAVAPGPHTLTARARDTSGNPAVSDPRSITVDNSDPRSVVGSFGPVTDMGDIAQQAVLMPGTGKVLFYKDGAGAQVLNPTTGAVTAVPLSRSDLFCAGQGTLPDGRLLINGGQAHTGGLGIKDNNFFDPATQKWSNAPSMAYKRWYPTMTPLADGKQLTTSGSQEDLTDIAPIPELYDPVANTWKSLPSATNPIPYYPFMYQLPNGKIAMLGATEQATDTEVLDPRTWTWSTVDSRIIDAGSSVQYAPGKFLKAGTSSDGNTPVRPSSAAAYVIDMNQPNPAWRSVAPMAFPRAFLNLTLLPDGTVLATGGESTADGVNAANAVNSAELWNPATETWTTLSAAKRPRLYHSVGLLLPDGRVMVSGGGNDGAVPNEPNYEMFSPPYLFKGARPTVTSVPATIQYGSSFTVATPDAADIASVRLIRPAAVTHAFDSNASTVPLSFTATASGLTVQAPSDPNLAVPGHYMLFVVNKKGVPAVAPFTRLPAPWEDSQAPTAPGGLTATAGTGAAALAWTAATDNNAVTQYRVHRSPVSGFTPAAANLVGTSTTTSFTDTGLAAGSYYYKIVAEDAAGNAGPASGEAGVTIVSSDTTPPVVSLTAPANGATVSGSVTLGATASDDVKMASVRFLVDGNAVGSLLTAAPYTTSWPSASFANGSHVVTAEATDTAGNVARATATVTLNNAGSTGLVAAYAFNEGTGSAVADASGTGNAGTLTGGGWSAAGKAGGAVSLDGSTSWVTVPDAASLHLTTGMTLEAWVKPSTATGGWRSVLMKERPAGMAYGMYAFDNSSKPPAVYGSFSGTDVSAAGSAALPVGQWSHLAGTFDGTTLRLYVNGIQVGSKAKSGSLASSTSPLRIGGNSVWGEYFAGLVDDVRIYQRALPAAEIQADLGRPVS